MTYAEATTTTPWAEKLDTTAKRVFDLTCAIVGLLLLSPALSMIVVLIWLDSGPPILYRGVRTGQHGEPFRIYKFRTMVQNAERVGGPSTGKDDPRVTQVGRYLRKYKLDELPQLINVLRNEMSIVGPRPEVPQYSRLYTGEERLILEVRPGITDYASLEFIHLDEVLGSEAPDQVYEEQVRPVKNSLRVQYVKERSFWKDMYIIVRTLLRLAGV